MLERTKCAECGGTGISFVETSAFLGLVKKQVPISCPSCGGKGYVLKLKPCGYCSGRGLVGNEKELCRVCNGTGTADDFAWVPRSQLVPGTHFTRACQVCRRRTPHEVATVVEAQEKTVSWEEEVSLRQVQKVQRVRVRCTECDDSYWIVIDPEAHPEERTEDMEEFLAAHEGREERETHRHP